MSDLSELYQAVILDHNARPRNWGTLDGATHHADGYNPLCGDKLRVYLLVTDDTIQDVKFEGSGCAISKASASLMTASLKGKTTSEAQDLFHKFHDLVTTDAEADLDELGKLAVFSGVREFPARVKCATLCWHTAVGALDGDADGVTTE